MPPKIKTKAEILAEATDVLSRRVGALADAVQINNVKIDGFQEEINKKPDDTELKWLDEEHSRRLNVTTLKIAIGVLTSVIVSSLVTFAFANHESKRRCEDNSMRTTILVETIKELDPQSDNAILQNAIHRLEEDKVNC